MPVSLIRVPSSERILRSAYQAFNSGEVDAAIAVDVHQVVREAETNRLLSDSHVRHRYRFRDGLVVRMDVVEG